MAYNGVRPNISKLHDHGRLSRSARVGLLRRARRRGSVRVEIGEQGWTRGQGWRFEEHRRGAYIRKPERIIKHERGLRHRWMLDLG